MIAAIYARKSTTENGVAEDLKSVTRQIENARTFASKKGWTVPDEFIFVDDGISGAEFERRPAFQRMVGMLKPRAPYQVVIVSEQKSLGRESLETGYTIKRFAKAGVDLVEYVHGRSLVPKSWIDKVTSVVVASADEAHQRQTSERTHEGHSKLAQKGYVTGGRVFGYRNVDVFSGKEDAHGRPIRSYVDRELNETEAAVVRRIFELYVSGSGLKAIAKQLIREGAPEPTPLKRKDGLRSPGWAPTTVRTILRREIYRGVIVWNKSRKRDDWGQVNQRPRPESDWMRTEREDLRIVSDDVWRLAESRRKDIEGRALRFETGRLSGRPPKYETRNLLAGLATCGVCGSSLIVETSGRKNGRVSEYVCNRHRRNGSCSNAMRIPVDELNEAILTAIEEHALTPGAIEQVVQLTERDDAKEHQEALEAEAANIEKRLTRLGEAIETGGDIRSLVERIRELEARRDAIERERASLLPIPRLPVQVIESRLEEWRRLLRQSPTQGRSVLQRVLNGRITFTPWPNAKGYEFSAQTRFDKLFSGIVVERPAWVPKGGPSFGIEDTTDWDYGRILERASYGKRMASPAGVPSGCGYCFSKEILRAA